MKRSTQRIAVSAALGGLVGLAGVGFLTKLLGRRVDLNTPQPDPARTYEEALARLEGLQALDDERVNPVCHTQLLTHGHKTERVIVLIHGLTNCPQQFVQFAPLWYKQGYNVLLPRMPRNGLSDRMTRDLRYLTAEELRAASDTYVDIASGLGERVTVLGLSGGGTMAAWIAQQRAVEQAVIIAPLFGLASIGPRFTSLVVRLLSLLPDIPTQNFSPFQDGPQHSYLGYSSHALAEVMRLAAAVDSAARKKAPATQSVLVVLNAGDPAVNNQMIWNMVMRWRKQDLKHLELYEFEKSLHLIHDLVDPEQREQQIKLVYPILMDLITHKGAEFSTDELLL